MGVKISDAPADLTITGIEQFPISDAGSPKRATISQVKDFTIDQIEAIAASTTVTGTDGAYILKDGALKPVAVNKIAQIALDMLWAKAAEASPANAHVVPLKNGANEKTVTLALLAEYVRSVIAAKILDVSKLDTNLVLTNTDKLLVTVGTTPKYVTYQMLAATVHGALAAYVGALTSVTAAGDSDAFYVLQGGAAKKITLKQITEHIGLGNPVLGPDVSAPDHLLQWADANRSVKDGPSIGTSIGITGSDSILATTKAVRDALSTAAAGALDTIWISASSMTPSTTAGATAENKEYATNLMTHPTLLFDGIAADQSAEFNLVMPEAWDRGAIRAKAYWTNGGPGANAGDWIRLKLAGGALANDDVIDAAAGAAVNLDDQLTADNDLHITAASAAMTIGGTPALGDMIHFKITRDFDYEGGGGTAMAVSCRLMGVLLQIMKTNNPAAW